MEGLGKLLILLRLLANKRCYFPFGWQPAHPLVPGMKNVDIVAAYLAESKRYSECFLRSFQGYRLFVQRDHCCKGL